MANVEYKGMAVQCKTGQVHVLVDLFTRLVDGGGSNQGELICHKNVTCVGNLVKITCKRQGNHEKEMTCVKTLNSREFEKKDIRILKYFLGDGGGEIIYWDFNLRKEVCCESP